LLNRQHSSTDIAARQFAMRSGVWRMLIFGVAIAVFAALLHFFARNNPAGGSVILIILGGLAAIGVFFLFSLALGIVRIRSQWNADPVAGKLVDKLDCGLLVLGPGNRIVFANQTYVDLLGAGDGTEIPNLETVFSRRTEAAEVIYRMANEVRKGQVCVEDFRLSHGLKSGDEGARWFRLRARQIEDEDTDGPLTVWQIYDITADRRRQETAFQELQNAINYLDHAPAGFLSSAPDGSITYINATLADWLGIDLAKFFPDSLHLTDIVLGEGMAMLESVKAHDRSGKTAIIDLDLARSDGTPLPVRLYHRVGSGGDSGANDSRTMVLNRMLSSTGDGAEAEIRFTRFFNNTPMAIAAIGADGSIHRTNAPFQRMFAALIDAAGGLEKITFEQLAAENDQKAMRAALEAAIAGKAKINPVDILVADDQERFVRIFISAVTNDNSANENSSMDGNDDRAIVYALDMTEQKALEEQFTQGQKMQAVGQLAGGVAHDFNNVLTAIIGFSDLLLANHRPSDPSFQDIMNIKQNANRAASLVRQLLAFSRRQTLRPQVLDLGDVLSDLRMLLDRLLGEKVDLEVVHGRDLWPIKADLSQFEQVIVNLAVNARDAMPDGGRLTVRTSNIDAGLVTEKYPYKEMLPGDYVLVEVIDEGLGMTEKIVEKIFEPFFSTKEVGKGTGLGLSTVYGIVKQTGGFIYAESEVGVGTTFRVFLPRYEASEETGDIETTAIEAADDRESKPKDLTGSARLLLVEDEDAVRAFASRALASRGYDVMEAASGVEALEILEESDSEFDLIISDVVMPEMDGPTLLTEVRKKHPHLKFVFMSGYAEDAFARNLPDNEKHQFGFLPKPFSLKQLATTVKEVLEE
jgi:two-component system, cell cycle sensor histidine kinase and response regulator CckA